MTRKSNTVCTPNTSPRHGYQGAPDSIRHYAKTGMLGDVPRLPNGTFVLSPEHIARANKIYRTRRG